MKRRRVDGDEQDAYSKYWRPGDLAVSAAYYGEAAHPKCGPEGGHVCQELSGRVCIETDCEQAAGTFWGPYWCPDHDAERIDRIGRQMDDLLAGLKPGDAR